MATYRSLRCDAPNLRIPRPLLSAVHPERRPTNAPLKFTLHTVPLQRASSVLLQHGSPTGSPTGSALRAHRGPRLSGEKRGGRYLPFCFIFAGARGAARAGERTAQPLPRDGRSRLSCEAATEHSAAFALRSSSCSLHLRLSTVFSTSTRGEIVERSCKGRITLSPLRVASSGFVFRCIALCPPHASRDVPLFQIRALFPVGVAALRCVPALICNRVASASPPSPPLPQRIRWHTTRRAGWQLLHRPYFCVLPWLLCPGLL